MTGRIAAVVTGDVNASSKMPVKDARRLEQLLKTCFENLVSELANAKAQGFTNFRGDSWQFIVMEPSMAVHATLFFRSALLFRGDREFSRRIHSAASIGFGPIQYMPSDVSSAGGGKAFENSGKRLDRLRRRVPGMGALGLGRIDLFLDSLLGLVDALVRNWTALQAQAVIFALQGLTQVEIAKKWTPPISQQAVHKHLSAAGWPAIEPALQWTKTTILDCITENNFK